MKIFTGSCMVCMQENGIPSDEFQAFEIADDSIYELVCSRGHTSTVHFQNDKYALLFEIGLSALVDGYNDAAVTRFAVSRERLLEHTAKVLLVSKGINLDDWSTYWQPFQASSERQLGAFFALIFCEQLSLIEQTKLIGYNEKHFKFRNEVIHKGKIPTSAEANHYAESVFEFAKLILLHTNSAHCEAVKKVLYHRLGQTSKNAKNAIVTIHSPMTIDPITLVDTDISWSSAISSYRDRHLKFLSR